MEETKQLIDLLAKKHMTVTTAESCTGGLISATLVDIPGASAVLKEAYVTYANESKQGLLGVRAETLADYGAVSEQTAREMVLGAAERAHADCAVAVTGIAGPEGGTEEKPVGTVYAGYKVGTTLLVKRYLFSGDRTEVRHQTAETAIRELLVLLSGSETKTEPDA